MRTVLVLVQDLDWEEDRCPAPGPRTAAAPGEDGRQQPEAMLLGEPIRILGSSHLEYDSPVQQGWAELHRSGGDTIVSGSKRDSLSRPEMTRAAFHVFYFSPHQIGAAPPTSRLTG